MSSRQTGGLPPLFDAEPPGAVASPQSGKSLVGNAGRAGHELEQPQTALVVELFDGQPEPLNHGVIVVITRSIFGVLSPVGDVDFGRPRYDEFQLAGVEHGHEAGVDHLVEALDQGLGLVGHAPLEPPLEHALDVLLLVALGHGQVLAVGLELLLEHVAGHLLRDGEGEVQAHVGDVVLLEPEQGLVELGVQVLEVAEGTGQAEQGLVEGAREERVQQVLVDQCQAQHPAAEAEPLVLVVHEGGHGADLHGVRVVGGVLEQAVVGVEELPRQQEEELAGRPPVVQPLLPREADVEPGLLQVLLGGRHDLGEGVLQQVVSPDVQLHLARALAVALRLQLPVEVAQLRLKVPPVGGGGPHVRPLET